MDLSDIIMYVGFNYYLCWTYVMFYIFHI